MCEYLLRKYERESEKCVYRDIELAKKGVKFNIWK